jgi:hypothetical protein
VERYLLSVHERFPIHVVVDPFQALRTVAILRGEGLQIEEMPQTMSATTAMGEVLFELLTHKQLRLYPASDLRTQALATTAIEHARGMRIAKIVGSKKIDAISALAMACVAAVKAGVGGAAPLRLLFSGTPELPDDDVLPVAARHTLWALLEPMLEGLTDGDESRFDRAADALEAHLIAVERDDPAMATRLRAVVDRVATTAEALDGVA